jgi:hypothetical protein
VQSLTRRVGLCVDVEWMDRPPFPTHSGVEEKLL